MGVGICLTCGGKAESERKLIPKYCSIECNNISSNTKKRQRKQEIKKSKKKKICRYCRHKEAVEGNGNYLHCSTYCSKRTHYRNNRFYYYKNRPNNFRAYKNRFRKNVLINTMRIINKKEKVKTTEETNREIEEKIIVNPYFLKR